MQGGLTEGEPDVIKPTAVQYEIEDGVNEAITICIDRDADPGVVSFTLDQQGGQGYLYVTLSGLMALADAAKKLIDDQ